MSTCRSCGAPIWWAKTAKGKPIPLNIDSHIAGNIEVRGGVAYYVTPDANAITSRYTSHFSDCPNATQHRKRKEAQP